MPYSSVGHFLIDMKFFMCLNNSSLIQTLILILHLVLGLTGFIVANYLIFKFLRLVLSFGLTVIVFVASYWTLANRILTGVVFPSCTWLYRRNVELNYLKFMSQDCQDCLVNLRFCIQKYLESPSQFDSFEDLYRSSYAIKVLIVDYQQQAKIQAKSSILHSDQIIFLEHITEIKQKMKKVTLQNINKTIWSAAISK